MKKISLFLCIITIFCFMIIYCTKKIDRPIDLTAFHNMDNDWKVVVQDTFAAGGSIKLNHDHWLMYFLHWRPLTAEKQDISIDYAKHLMLNFWGPNMPFTIIGNGGITEICGHPAYFIDGSFAEGVVKTRFIVWNCPETKRQFIADCNINKRRGTADKLLEIQYEISTTISCHGEETVSHHPKLIRKYSSEKFNLSFFIPQNWHTAPYPEPEWFPQGQNKTRGSLWTLLKDSDKYIDLIWNRGNQEISREIFNKYLEKLNNSTWDLEKVRYTVSQIKIDDLSKKNDYMQGSGSYTIHYQYQDQKGKASFLYRAFMKNHKDDTYFLLASIIARDEWWKRSVDLIPDHEVFDLFIQQDVFPNIPAFRQGINYE